MCRVHIPDMLLSASTAKHQPDPVVRRSAQSLGCAAMYVTRLPLLLPASACPFCLPLLLSHYYAPDVNHVSPLLKFPDMKPLTTPAKVYNCWQLACSMAVLHAAPNWTMHLFSYPDGTPMLGNTNPSSQTVIVTMFAPNLNTLAPYILTANVANECDTEDHPNGAWWHDAMTQAILQLGTKVTVTAIHPDGTFDEGSGDSAVGLTTLTGRPATTKIYSDYNGGDQNNQTGLNDFFNDLTRANTTPVVLASKKGMYVTNDTVPLVAGDHAYAVLNTTDYGNGTKVITCMNPWGIMDVFKVWDLWINFYSVNHLTDWEMVSWPEGQGQGQGQIGQEGIAGLPGDGSGQEQSGEGQSQGQDQGTQQSGQSQSRPDQQSQIGQNTSASSTWAEQGQPQQTSTNLQGPHDLGLQQGQGGLESEPEQVATNQQDATLPQYPGRR